MPSYRVLAKGFYDGRTYDPNGKRPVLVTDKPIAKKDLPSWLEPIKETAAASKKRAAAQKAATAAAKKKAADDKKEIDEASFLGDGESAGVETLG